MAVNVQSTSDLSQSGVKLLVYGQAGAGKTSLIPTLPAPLILSAEGGLLSIKDSGLPFIEIKNISDLYEAFKFIKDSTEAKQFQSIAIDSLSEIADIVLSEEKKHSKDPRTFHSNTQTTVYDFVRKVRDLPGKNVYMSAKLEKVQDETGQIMYSVGMPGQKMGPAMPYFFDEVLAMRVEKDADGNTHRALMCDSDGQWAAKDRSGKLDQWESPDLGAIINKIMGVQL
jgi:hypothetical protein